MANRYVDVTITRETKAVSQKGFGLPLIFSTDAAKAYTVYTDLSSIGTDFGTTSKTYKLASRILGQTPKVSEVAVYGISTYVSGTDLVSELSAALNELVKTNNDWYYLTCTQQLDTEITELSNWVATQDKLYFASTANEALAPNLVNDRAILLVHDKPEEYPAEAWVGVGAPLEIGSFTWTFKTLNGIVPVGFSTTKINTIETNNASTYIRHGGVNITSKGVATSGEYVDIMQGHDYLKARITEDIYGLLVRKPKIPYTEAGIALVVAELEKRLKIAANMGIIATDIDGNPLYSVDAPSPSEVTTNDKANRMLPDVNWTATLAGAIEHVDVNGVLTL